jgi:hypothetical protein
MFVCGYDEVVYQMDSFFLILSMDIFGAYYVKGILLGVRGNLKMNQLSILALRELQFCT